MTATVTLTATASDQTPPPLDASDHWRELIGQIGSDVGQYLSSALERITVFSTTGKIDRSGLRLLREEIEAARRIGMIGQQLARFASGRIRQSPEQLPLAQMVREVLLQRGREISARGATVQQALRPAEVVVDATLLHSLLQALLDWALEQSPAALELRLDIRPWPPQARLKVRLTGRAASAPGVQGVATGFDSATLDSISWRLVQQIAATLDLVLERHDAAAETITTLDFPHTLQDQIEGVSAIEIDQGFGVSDNSKPLAGSHVLVVAARRDLRNLIRESIRDMGLLVDFVNSIEEAEVFCRDALPHAIVYESALGGERADLLRNTIMAEVPNFAFVEIDEEGSAFELSSEASGMHAKVGRDAVLQSLPSALMFELSRSS